MGTKYGNGLVGSYTYHCGASASYKVTVPSGYSCKITFRITVRTDYGGWAAGSYSLSFSGCSRTVYKDQSGECSTSGKVGPGSYTAQVTRTLPSGNTRPELYYTIEASFSECEYWKPCDPASDSCSSSSACGKRCDAPVLTTDYTCYIYCDGSDTVIEGRCVAKESNDQVVESVQSGSNGWKCRFKCNTPFCTANGCAYIKCRSY